MGSSRIVSSLDFEELLTQLKIAFEKNKNFISSQDLVSLFPNTRFNLRKIRIELEKEIGFKPQSDFGFYLDPQNIGLSILSTYKDSLSLLDSALGFDRKSFEEYTLNSRKGILNLNGTFVGLTRSTYQALESQLGINLDPNNPRFTGGNRIGSLQSALEDAGYSLSNKVKGEPRKLIKLNK